MSIKEQTDLGQIIEIPIHFLHYKYIRTIGTGASSVVALFQDEITGTLLAGKVVSRLLVIQEGRLPYIERELRILQTISHPNIVRVLDLAYLPDLIIVLQEYCEKGDLLHFILQQGKLAPHLIKDFFYQLIQAVAHLHHRDFAHRDLKPDNIFLDGNFAIKLGDLGLSHEASKGQLLHTLCGTLYYSAPEVLAERPYDGKMTDIWALGILLFCMWAGTLPWRSSNVSDVRTEITSANIVYPDGMPLDIIHIIQGCCKLDPSERFTIDSLIKLPWFKDEAELYKKKLVKSRVTHSVPFNPSRILSKQNNYCVTRSAAQMVLKSPIRSQKFGKPQSSSKKTRPHLVQMPNNFFM